MPSITAVSANWNDLISQFSCPEWFRDAKFGVWSHWGPQAVPGQGDWYARFMYMQGHESYQYHCRTYGHPSKVGFKDIIEKWTAEKFDAEALVGFYADNGAKYFMGQAAHCDNFDLFDSTHHRWNSTNYGPKRDILGEYAAATQNVGLRFGFSEHLAWSYNWFNVNKDRDTTGPFAGVPYDGNDPANEELYFKPHPETNAAYAEDAPEFAQHWKSRMIDAITKYQPDIFYTDGGIYEQPGLDVMAYFYNQATERNGQADGVYTYKNVHGQRPGFDSYLGQYKPGAGVEDLEHGVLSDINAEPWQTDTSSGPWYWNPATPYKTPEQIVHTLADIVSKNGNLLLNYTQRPDGSLDEETTWIVEEVGAWLATNGDAIYGTRPWKSYGEGPNAFAQGEFGLQKSIGFGAEDFRYTTRGDTLYAIALGRPDSNRPWVMKTLAGDQPRSVSLLGHDEPVSWRATADGLEVAAPTKLKGSYAWALVIEF